MHCNAVGWLTPEGYRLDEANALLILRVATNNAAQKMRAFNNAAKKDGGEAANTGPADYYVKGRYNGD